MRRHASAGWLTVALLLAVGTARALESANFKISDDALNSGGHSDPALVLTSSSFRISLDAIGDGVAGQRALAGLSYRADGGFVDAYAPPAEVDGVHWIDRTRLVWGPAKSAGIYSLYSGSLETMRQEPLGDCLQAIIGGIEAVLPTVPIAGTGRFYLVTARNHVDEEGTRGFGSEGTERPPGASCP